MEQILSVTLILQSGTWGIFFWLLFTQLWEYSQRLFVNKRLRLREVGSGGSPRRAEAKPLSRRRRRSAAFAAAAQGNVHQDRWGSRGERLP